MSRRAPRILAFSGPSGAGKTTLLVELIPALAARGVRVAALKRSGHRHAFDRPGKDSARLRGAGAVAVALQGPAELAWFGPPRRGGARALARLLPPVELVLAEGFGDERLPRIEVHRTEVSPRFLCARDPDVIAVVSDREPPRALPWFGPHEVEALAEFVARFTRRARRASKRALAPATTRAQRVPGEAGVPVETAMARTSSRSGMSRRGGGRRGAGGQGARRRAGARAGGATVREAGRKGGRRTLARRGPEFYSRIGRKGGKASGTARRRAGARRTARRRASR